MLAVTHLLTPWYLFRCKFVCEVFKYGTVLFVQGFTILLEWKVLAT